MVRTYKLFLSEIRNKILPVYLFCGPEDFLIDEALQQIKKFILANTNTEFNYRLFYNGEAEARDIITEAETLPFLAERRLIVVKDVTKLKAAEIDKIITYLEKPSAFSCLVLIGPSMKSDHRLYQAVAGSTTVVKFQNLKGRELDEWLEDRFREKGKRLEPGAGRVIIEKVGEQLRALDRAVETLCSYTGKKNLVRIDDVEKAVGKSHVLDIFKLVDAVGSKKADLALEILQQLQRQGVGETYCLNMLARQLRQIKECRLAKEGGLPPGLIADRLNVSPYIGQKIMGQARNFDISELRRGFKFLLEADTDIKTGRLKPWLVLERLVLRLCSVSS